MAAYFARRLLLLIPTFLGITMLVFAITRFVPGGPIDQMLMQMQSGGQGGGEAGGSGGSNGSSVDIPPEALASLEKYYHFDWPLWRQYLQFLGPLNLDERGVFGDDVTTAQVAGWYVEEGEAVEAGQAVARIRMTEPDKGAAAAPTVVSQEIFAPSDGVLVKRHFERDAMTEVGAPLFEWRTQDGAARTYEVPDIWSKTWAGLLTLDLGNSYKYEVPVIDLIVQRFPISIRFGLTGFLLAYFICIPLGIAKAVRHGTKFDFMSSAMVFIGYSIPGWALGVVLLVLFGGGSFWDIFPLGAASESDSLGRASHVWGKIGRPGLHHTVLPVFCLRDAGSFAALHRADEELPDGEPRAGLRANGLRQGPARAPRHHAIHALAELADSDLHGAGPRARDRDGGQLPRSRRSSTSTASATWATRRSSSRDYAVVMGDPRDQHAADPAGQHPERRPVRPRGPAHPLHTDPPW